MKIVELSADEFDGFSKTHKLANPWQTSFFGKAAEKLGYEVLYLGFEDNGNIFGCTLLLTKNVYLGQSISYAPRGLLIDYENYKQVEVTLKTLVNYLSNRKIMSLTFDPEIILNVRNRKGLLLDKEDELEKRKYQQLINGPQVEPSNNASNIRELIIRKCNFEYCGEKLFFEGIMPRWYAISPLQINPKNLLNMIGKNKRKKLIKVSKLGVEILKDDTKDINSIYEVLKENGKPIEYYQNLINGNEDCEVFIARINPKTYIQHSKYFYMTELERNDALNNKVTNRKGKNTQKYINAKMESDKAIEGYKEHIKKATDILTNYPSGKIIAVSIVMKANGTINIMEEAYLKEYKSISALHLTRFKILRHYANSNYKYINYGYITGDFDRKRNIYYGINESKLALGARTAEYIGEFGIRTNKAMYTLYQASTKDRFKFKI